VRVRSNVCAVCEECVPSLAKPSAQPQVSTLTSWTSTDLMMASASSMMSSPVNGRVIAHVAVVSLPVILKLGMRFTDVCVHIHVRAACVRSCVCRVCGRVRVNTQTGGKRSPIGVARGHLFDVFDGLRGDAERHLLVLRIVLRALRDDDH